MEHTPLSFVPSYMIFRLFFQVVRSRRFRGVNARSRAWFDWLATLTPFRFVGQSGRFTAYRDTKRGKRTRCWAAQRSLHGRHYRHWLGVTDRLTIGYLEQLASHIQSHLTTL